MNRGPTAASYGYDGVCLPCRLPHGCSPGCPCVARSIEPRLCARCAPLPCSCRGGVYGCPPAVAGRQPPSLKLTDFVHRSLSERNLVVPGSGEPVVLSFEALTSQEKECGSSITHRNGVFYLSESGLYQLQATICIARVIVPGTLNPTQNFVTLGVIPIGGGFGARYVYARLAAEEGGAASPSKCESVSFSADIEVCGPQLLSFEARAPGGSSMTPDFVIVASKNNPDSRHMCSFLSIRRCSDGRLV